MHKICFHHNPCSFVHNTFASKIFAHITFERVPFDFFSQIVLVKETESIRIKRAIYANWKRIGATTITHNSNFILHNKLGLAEKWSSHMHFYGIYTTENFNRGKMRVAVKNHFRNHGTGQLNFVNLSTVW